jgi:hypothetical protein
MGTLTTSGRSIFHITYFTNPSDDEYWVTGTMTGTITFVPYDPTQPSYSGRFTTWFGDNLNEKNATSTFTFSARLTGTDGSVVTDHEVGHYTVSATGVSSPTFDKNTVTCG